MSKPICPCCGKAIEREIHPAVLGLFVQLPPAERAVFEALCLRMGQWVKSSILLDALYGDDPEGGPHYAAAILSMHLRRIRARIEPLGLAIDGRSTHGDTGRRLRWTEQ